MTRHPRILAAAASLSLAAATVSALPPRLVAARPAPPAGAAAPQIPPEKAWLDFETGQFREVTAEDLERLDRMRADEAASVASPGIVEHGHGMRSAGVPEAYHLALAVRQAPDGTLEIVCAPNKTIGRRLGMPRRPRAEER